MSFRAHWNHGVNYDPGFYEYHAPLLPLRGIDSPLRLGIGPWRSVVQSMTGQGFLTGMPFATGGAANYHDWSPGPVQSITGQGFLTGSQRTQPQTD